MRFEVQGPPGAVARNPESALSALADIAEADGADRVEWLEKAATSAGATQVAVPVSQAPRYRVVEDTVKQALTVYDTAMTLAVAAIQERLEQAIRDADTDRYRALLPPEG